MPEVIISGSAGRLEARYVHSQKPNAPVALILHPNPKQGGTMNNRITYRLFKAFAMRGFSTLRFNFRGVGKSQGEFGDGEGELTDAATALDWLQECNPNMTAKWVAGFSFGAWIAMQLLMRRPEIHRFISVSPPANKYDFGFLAPCPSSGLILQGDRDEIVTEESVSELAQRIRDQRGLAIDYHVIEGAGHFFENQIDSLSEYIGAYLDNAMGDVFL